MTRRNVVTALAVALMAVGAWLTVTGLATGPQTPPQPPSIVHVDQTPTPTPTAPQSSDNPPRFV